MQYASFSFWDGSSALCVPLLLDWKPRRAAATARKFGTGPASREWVRPAILDPHAYFDNESDDAWSEFGDQPQSEQEYEEAMPPTEHEVVMSAEIGTHTGSSTMPTPVPSATQAWEKTHANVSFVPAKSKGVTTN